MSQNEGDEFRKIYHDVLHDATTSMSIIFVRIGVVLGKVGQIDDLDCDLETSERTICSFEKHRPTEPKTARIFSKRVN